MTAKTWHEIVIEEARRAPKCIHQFATNSICDACGANLRLPKEAPRKCSHQHATQGICNECGFDLRIANNG